MTSSPLFQVPVPFAEMAVDSSEADQVLLVDSWTGQLCRESTEQQDEEARLLSNEPVWENEMNPIHQQEPEPVELNDTSLTRDKDFQYCKRGAIFRSQQEQMNKQGNNFEKSVDRSVFCVEDSQEEGKSTEQQRTRYSEAQNTSSNQGRNFGQSSDLMKHQIIGTREKLYMSSYCGNSFNQAQDLTAKERTHSGLRHTYKCSHCGKSFSCISSFKEHLRIHTGESPYRCSHCGKTIGHSSVLREHVRTDTGEKLYTCSDCAKSFNQKRYLTVHERLHRGENPYKCVHCGKSFPKRSKLVIHERIHTGENPFVCSECGKGFNQKGNLMTHMRLHTGEKPYKCAHCGKQFSQKAGLSAHEKTHTGRKRAV
ncbi:zinc finger protein 664-like [Elgaria multicarinata webbii]|uniref:zinc finger protein 664-like n=1 Tax=Elgaria multicarinata webbii TaxID=159646 RepID=UPI002FCCC86E